MSEAVVLAILFFRIFFLGGPTPFHPPRSGPKAASRPSRQKQIPSSVTLFALPSPS